MTAVTAIMTIMTGGVLIMSSPIKENGWATGLRITFAIIMAVTIGIFTNCVVMHNTIYNQRFWKKTLMSEDIKEALRDELTRELKEYVVANSNPIPGTDTQISLQDVYDLETGDEFADELIDYTMDEILEMMLTGDVEIDEDRFDDIFDEYGEDFFDELEESGVQVDREGFLEAKDQLFDELNDSMEEIQEEKEDQEVFEYLNVDRYKRQNLVTMIITGVFNLIMLVVLIVIHKNKFRPIRAVGIAGTVTEITSLIGWVMIWGIFKAAGSAMESDEEIFMLLLKAALNSILKVVAIFGIASAIAVVLIIIGCVGAGIVNSAYRKKNPGAGQMAYAAPVPMASAPVAPAPVAQPVQQAPVAAQPVAPAPAPVAAPVAPQPAGWTCPNCGNTGITTNFCNNCGTARPQ